MNEILNPDFLICSPDYQEAMDSVVFPYLRSHEKQHSLHGKDGTPLFCVSYEAEVPVGTVLFVHGFSENAYKYSEMIHSLLRNGYSVIAYDQRGHGRSGRDSAIPDRSVTHVDHFEDYVQDLEIICREILTSMPEPHMVFAHSMGGAVAALFLESHPGVFSAAVLTSPMIAPNTGIPVSVAKAVCRAAILFGRGKHRPFFLKPYSGPEDFSSSCATDPVRFSWYDSVRISTPDFQNSVPTYRWIWESSCVTRKILSAGIPEKVACPVLLCAADKDSNVLPEPQKEFIRRVQHGKYIVVPGSRHEIFRSVNDVFFPWWHSVLEYLSGSVR